MTARIRRRRRTRSAASEPTVAEQQVTRAMRQIVASEKARVLPSDQELDRMSEVKPSDIDRAESLWDEAQRRAGTGLEGLLSAKSDETDG